MASHYEVVSKKLSAITAFGRDDSLVLSDLAAWSKVAPWCWTAPFWFMREGELVLNLFQGDLRIASIAFTLCHGGELCIFIGAVQGIHKGIESESRWHLPGCHQGLRRPASQKLSD